MGLKIHYVKHRDKLFFFTFSVTVHCLHFIIKNTLDLLCVTTPNHIAILPQTVLFNMRLIFWNYTGDSRRYAETLGAHSTYKNKKKVHINICLLYTSRCV